MISHKTPPCYSLRTLFGLGRAAGLTAEQTKQMAYDLCQKDSMTALTQQERNEMCFLLIRYKEQRSATATNPYRASEQQRHLMREDGQLLGWHKNPERLELFLQKRFVVAAVRWLTAAQAAKVIEALKQMYRRGEAAK